MASVKNLASGTLVNGINVGDTTLTVAVGSGTSEQLLAVWPTPPFYITVAPDYPASGVSNSLDSEIMSVTAIAHSSGNIIMTVTRAQRGTTAKAFNANAIVTNAIYADDAVLLGPNGTTEPPEPWIETDDISDGAVTNDKIAWSSTVKTGTITMNPGWNAGGSSYCRKQGNVVQWNINLTGDSTMVTNTNYVVGKLPAGFIPVEDTVQTGIYRLSTQPPVIMYCIAYATTGNILVVSPIDIPSGGIRFIGGTFIV